MKFIVTRYVAGKGRFYPGPEFLVGHVLGNVAVAGKNALGVGVNDKDVFMASVEKDGISGFRSDAVNGEELFAQLGGGSAKHARKRAGILPAEETDKDL